MGTHCVSEMRKLCADVLSAFTPISRPGCAARTIGPHQDRITPQASLVQEGAQLRLMYSPLPP